MRIVFLGTPDFAVASLKALVENNCNVVGVVTAPDRKAGRGLQLKESPVKQFALKHKIPVLQPTNLKSEEFLAELKALNTDLQIVVAFRMLPEAVWQMPPKGTFNLHASLLPQYRGAAPINWAIMNGEKVTGVTTFFLKHEIDTGNILFQEKVPITKTDNAGTLHDKLMKVGAELVVKTTRAIESDSYTETPQQAETTLKAAPKIFKEDCRINWERPAAEVYNHIRGLSPYPAAWTDLISPEGKATLLKIYQCQLLNEQHNHSPGQVITDGKSHLKIAAEGGLLEITELQQAGKKRMAATDFLRGFPLNNDWKVS